MRRRVDNCGDGDLEETARVEFFAMDPDQFSNGYDPDEVGLFLGETWVPGRVPSHYGVWLPFDIPLDLWAEAARRGLYLTTWVDRENSVEECREIDNSTMGAEMPSCSGW